MEASLNQMEKEQFADWDMPSTKLGVLPGFHMIFTLPGEAVSVSPSYRWRHCYVKKFSNKYKLENSKVRPTCKAQPLCTGCLSFTNSTSLWHNPQCKVPTGTQRRTRVNTDNIPGEHSASEVDWGFPPWSRYPFWCCRYRVRYIKMSAGRKRSFTVMNDAPMQVTVVERRISIASLPGKCVS